ncbi:MAG: hypothetical protein EBZ18_02605, partial [Alphaproteobacteria bacterium]|nr:hypothetical protein [Alphaproteobacteria bacterium]
LIIHAADDLARLGHRVLLVDRAGRIKPCGGAIPPRAIRDFEIPDHLLVAKIGCARMVSPSDKRVDIPIENGFVGMVDREHFDEWLRERAEGHGAERFSGQFSSLIDTPDAEGYTQVDLISKASDQDEAQLRQVRARFVIGADGAKLSKRHGALSATAYRDMGFLPEAMCNYLLRLGWSHGDEEIISRKQAIDWFDLAKIGRAAARFDPDKLTAINAHYIRALPTKRQVDLILGGNEASPAILDRLHKLAPAFAERAQMLGDLPAMAGFAAKDGAPELDPEAAGLLTEEVCENLLSLATALPDDLGDNDTFKTWLGDWLTTNDLKMKDIGPGLRAAVTGMKQTPDIVLITQVLGTSEVRQRIHTICKKAGKEV